MAFIESQGVMLEEVLISPATVRLKQIYKIRDPSREKEQILKTCYQRRLSTRHERIKSITNVTLAIVSQMSHLPTTVQVSQRTVGSITVEPASKSIPTETWLRAVATFPESPETETNTNKHIRVKTHREKNN